MIQFDYTKTPGKKRTRFYSPSPDEALVSVITPFYNAGEYFEETFNSVMNQTFPWFEWVIVNDGSTKKEDVELLEEFAKKDKRIRVIHQKNAGPSSARNNGFVNAKTDLVVPLDADDLLAPQYLECLYWSLYYNPDAAWSYSDSYGFQEQEYVWKYAFDAERMKKENLLVSTAMIRKADFEQIGGYKIEKGSYHEDWRFWLDMLAEHKKPVHVVSELFWYRRTDSGRLSSIEQNSERQKFTEQIIKDAGQKIDGNIKAVEYPLKKSAYPFYKPQYISWDKISNKKKGKKILWLIPWMVMGGADKFNLDAIAGLNGLGYENCILTTLDSKNDWRQKFEAYTDEIFCMSDFLDPVHYLEFVSYYIQSRQIDVLMVTCSYDGYYMLPWLRQHFPELVIIDYVHMEEWYWRAGGHARPSGAMTGISEMTYVCNSATRDIMIEKLGSDPDKIDCMYIGVDDHYYAKEKVETGYLHKMLGLEPEIPIVLFPCRIHEQKRPFMLLDIAAKVKEKIPNVVFVVVGDGEQLDELKQSIKEKKLSDTIYCIGRSNEMRACYRDSKLTLICSLKEGLALTAYESCAMGIPVVSSDVGGQSDLIGSDVGALVPLQQSEENDLNKRIFPISEVQDYADHIVKILNDKKLAEQLGKNGRKKIEEYFSIDKMIEKFDAELRRLSEDDSSRNRRIQLSDALKQMPGYASEFYTMYNQWKYQLEEAEEIWASRCWMQNQLEKVYNAKDGEIARMYQRMIEIPVIGKMIQKLANTIWRLAGRV